VVLATTTLADRISRSDADLWIAWFEAMADLAGNPYGVEVRNFGSATALIAHGTPVSCYNKVMGLRPEDAGVVPDIIAFYRERSIPCRIDVNPFDTSSELAECLTSCGFRVADLQSNLHARLKADTGVSLTGVGVEAVSDSEIDGFAELYARAYYEGGNAPPGLVAFRSTGVKARFGRPGWRFYMTIVDGEQAGGGLLYVRDGVATLAGGATLAKFRRRGCQTALMHRRLLDAAAHGCDLVVSRCAAGSTSQRNMERAGMRVAYVKHVWEQRPFD
jgi:hypothetical protein